MIADAAVDELMKLNPGMSRDAAGFHVREFRQLLRVTLKMAVQRYVETRDEEATDRLIAVMTSSWRGSQNMAQLLEACSLMNVTTADCFGFAANLN